MARASEEFLALQSGYLFPEVARRIRAWQEKNPGKAVLKLSIGNTTEAITPSISRAMHREIELLSDRSTYTGYGDYSHAPRYPLYRILHTQSTSIHR